jgi:hypoxanthine phosphoribosyltransferase
VSGAPAPTEAYEQDPYTWEMFDADVLALARAIKRSTHCFDGIYPVPRGGLVPAVALSHVLDLPIVLRPSQGLDVLVVDDNVITGGVLAEFEGYATAVLVHNPELSTRAPTFHARVMDGWPAFPWEVPSCRL